MRPRAQLLETRTFFDGARLDVDFGDNGFRASIKSWEGTERPGRAADRQRLAEFPRQHRFALVHVARLTAAGRPDTTFSGDGFTSVARAGSVDADGVAAGRAEGAEVEHGASGGA